MKGWNTRTFTEKYCLHHREMGTAQSGLVHAKFKSGAKDYAIGNHLLWEVFRSAYQMTRKPFVLGGIALGAGYLWASVRRVERPVSPELVAFLRREQMYRLTKAFTGSVSSGKKSVLVPGRTPSSR
jgi:poly-beta-1,6-N-acetyl-D-glucosamine synthase